MGTGDYRLIVVPTVIGGSIVHDVATNQEAFNGNVGVYRILHPRSVKMPGYLGHRRCDHDATLGDDHGIDIGGGLSGRRGDGLRTVWWHGVDHQRGQVIAPANGRAVGGLGPVPPGGMGVDFQNTGVSGLCQCPLGRTLCKLDNDGLRLGTQQGNGIDGAADAAGQCLGGRPHGDIEGLGQDACGKSMITVGRGLGCERLAVRGRTATLMETHQHSSGEAGLS